MLIMQAPWCSVNASVVVGVFNQTTQEVEEYFLGPGDIGNVPKGLGHYIKEVGVRPVHARACAAACPQ